MSFTRIAPLLRQRLFTTSTRTRSAISFEDAAASELTANASEVPKLGKAARWYLPTMAAIALGLAYIPKAFSSSETALLGRRANSLGSANTHIGFGIVSALNDVNHKVHVPHEPSQQEKNMMMMDLYGERSSLEDMERAIAGIEEKLNQKRDRNKVLEEAYGERKSIKDLERAMRIYEVQ